jgi:hypothetical protein
MLNREGVPPRRTEGNPSGGSISSSNDSTARPATRRNLLLTRGICRAATQVMPTSRASPHPVLTALSTAAYEPGLPRLASPAQPSRVREKRRAQQGNRDVLGGDGAGLAKAEQHY